MSRGNPAWTRDEVVLALDLYFDLDKPIKRRDSRILELSRVFQLMAAARAAKGGPNFRNATSVYFKMNNFLELDPARAGKGFDNYSDLDEEVWKEFAGKRKELREEAQGIRARLNGGSRTTPALTQEVLEAWDEIVRRSEADIPADKTGAFSIAAFRSRLRPIREELRDEMARQLPAYPQLAGLKSYFSSFWQRGPKGAKFKSHIWNFLASDNKKTRARLQAVFTIEKTVRPEFVAYPALDRALRYDISKVSAALQDGSAFAEFRTAMAALPRGFFLWCKTGSGNTIDEFVDEMPDVAWEDLHKSGVAVDAYFVVGVDRPRERLSHLTSNQLASLALADLSDLGSIRELFEGKASKGAPRTLDGNPPVARTRRASAPAPKAVYRPEFSGTKTYVPPKSAVEADCRHGLVVDALATELSARNVGYGNDQFRDLYIVGDDRPLKVLFEVKTDLRTGSIYSAVGQLMLHGAAQDRPPILVAVLPGKPDQRTAQALERLAIRVLPYEMADAISFPTFDELLALPALR